MTLKNVSNRSLTLFVFHLCYGQVCYSLLAHKAFVNARSVTGLTALHLAAVEGYTQLVRDLIVSHSAQKDSLSLVSPPSVVRETVELLLFKRERVNIFIINPMKPTVCVL